MMARTTLAILTALCVASAGTQRIAVDSMATLVRAYSIAAIPGLNPAFQVDITEHVVDGLFDSVGIQLADAVYRAQDGTWFNEKEFVFHGGTVREFAGAFGGHGLMSGVVQGETLFYTYSWGSGIHRSIVGRLFLDHDTLVIQETGGYEWVDLFVFKSAGDSIFVQQGAYQSFNVWTPANQSPWRAVIENGSGLVILDSAGREVPPDFAPLGARNAKLSPGNRLGRSAGRMPAGAGDRRRVNCKGQAVREGTTPSLSIDISSCRRWTAVGHRLPQRGCITIDQDFLSWVNGDK